MGSLEDELRAIKQAAAIDARRLADLDRARQAQYMRDVAAQNVQESAAQAAAIQSEQRAVLLLRQLNLARKLEEINRTVWHGAGKVRDYTVPYEVDEPNGGRNFLGRQQFTSKTHRGIPVLVLEAAHPQRYEYKEYYGGRFEHGAVGGGETHYTGHVRSRNINALEPVLLVFSLRGYGVAGNESLHIQLGTDAIKSNGLSISESDAGRAGGLQHSRGISHSFGEAEIPIISSGEQFTDQLNKALASLLFSADPTGQYFGQLRQLPPQPVGKRTGPPGYI